MKRTLYAAEHDDYRAMVRAFIERDVVPHYAEWERAHRTPKELFRQVGALGALGFGVPEQWGGTGVHDFRYNAILGEEAARAGVAPALVGPVLVADICVPYFMLLADDAQRDRWLPGIVAGDRVCALAMTEPGTGSDLAGIQTRAVREGDEYVINGSKMFITNGLNADIVIVAARTGADRHGGLSLFVIETDMPGFARSSALEKMGLHAQDTAELIFSDLRVPARNLLGEEGGGFRALTRNLAQERLSVAVGAVAAAVAAFDATLAYVRQRQAFGAPLSALQAVRMQIAEMSTEIDVAQAHVDASVHAHNAGGLTAVDAAKAKWWATEMQGRVLDRCVQLHGGYGYMREYPVARAWADARVSRIYGGATDIMKDLIGRSLVRI